MSRKKSNPEDIAHTPFKALQGVWGSASIKAEKSVPAKPLPAAKKPVEIEDPRLFEKEMRGLGVKRLQQEKVFADVSAVQLEIPAGTMDGDDGCEPDDVALFRQALNDMDCVFKEEPVSAEIETAAPRRLRQLRLGQLQPEAKLDLHGLTCDEATPKVRFFLENAHYQGYRTVLIITGKGSPLHETPRLRDAVTRLLNQSRDRLLEWVEAPRHCGGSGALVVFLRGSD